MKASEFKKLIREEISKVLTKDMLEETSTLKEEKSLFTFGKYKNSGVVIDKARNLIHIYQQHDKGSHSVAVDYDDIHKLGEFLKNMPIPPKTPPSKINNLQRMMQGLEPI